MNVGQGRVNRILHSRYSPVLLLVWLLMPFLLLTYYNFPSSDDYSFYALLQDLGFAEFMRWGYLYWGGRYTALFITGALNPLVDDTYTLYKVYSAIITVAFTHSLYLFVQTVARKMGVINNNAWFTAIVVAFVWFYMPNVTQLVYWFSSSTSSYTTGATAFFYLLHLHFSAPLSGWRKWAYWLLPIVVAGSSEVTMLLLVATIGMLGLYYMVKKIKLTLTQYIVLAVAIVALAASILAPGNFARKNALQQSGASHTVDVVFVLTQTLRQTLHLLSPDFLFSLFILPFIALLIIVTPNYVATKNMRWVAKWLVVFSLGIFPLFLLPYFWSTGLYFIPLRVLNFVFMGFSLLFIPGAYILLKPVLSKWLVNRVVQVGLVVLLLVGVGLRSNLRTAVTGLYHANEYMAEMDNRFNILKANKGKAVVVPEIENWRVSVFYIDLKHDSTYWYNEGLARYYGVKSVAVPDDGIRE